MISPKRAAFAAGTEELERRMKQQHKANPVRQLLAEVPGIGPTTALSLALTIDPGRFTLAEGRRNREKRHRLPAWDRLAFPFRLTHVLTDLQRPAPARAQQVQRPTRPWPNASKSDPKPPVSTRMAERVTATPPRRALSQIAPRRSHNQTL